MKKGIHPNWHDDCQVTCSCGNSFVTGSSQKSLQVDICDQCHPFFTGEMKFVDRQGRVDKFQQKMKAAQAKQAQIQARRQAKKKQDTNQGEPESYQQILRHQQRAIRQITQDKKGAAQSAQAKTAA